MEKKYRNFILIFMFCSLNYFLYFEIFKDDLMFLFKDKQTIFFLIFIFFNMLFILLYFLISFYKQIKTYKNQISQYKYKFIKSIKNNKKKQKQLFEEKKQESLCNLISNIAHQWKQPLTAISFLSTSMQLYEQKDLKLKNIIKNCEMISQNVQCLSSIIDILISARQIKLDSNKELFNFNYMLKNFVQNNEYPNIKIEIQMAENCMIYTYKQELLKVLWNVINNSKENLNKKLLENKKINISVFTKKECLIIKVKDNAGGIDEKIIDSIFEPYTTSKFKSRNIGLGLYLSYTSVKYYLKGTIEAKNIFFIDKSLKKEFKGALFTIKIPKVVKNS